MLWGDISVKDLIGYHSFKTITDGSSYVQDHLIPNARRQFGRRWRMQQDNDPKHKSRLVQQFLSSEIVEVIVWSSNSSEWKNYGRLSNIVWRNEK